MFAASSSGDRDGRYVEGDDAQPAIGEPQRLVAEAAGDVDGDPGAGNEGEEIGMTVEHLGWSWFGRQRGPVPVVPANGIVLHPVMLPDGTSHRGDVVPGGARVGTSSS